MIFYFYNSYQQSFSGYQLSGFRVGDSRLRRISPETLGPTVKSCLMNSGARVILYRKNRYRNKNGEYVEGDYVLGVRGISIKNVIDGRKWYLNFVVKAGATEAGRFRTFVYKYYFQHDGFLESLAGWFVAEPESELSYSLDMECFSRYDNLPFVKSEWGSSASYQKHRKDLAWLDHKPGEGEIGLLIPEADEEYFRRRNPAFRKMKIIKCLTDRIL